MNDSKHILLRQSLEVHAAVGDGREQADVLTRFCREKWPQMLEKALDRFDDPNMVIRLDTVNITVDVLSTQNMEEAVEAALNHELPLALERAIAHAELPRSKAKVAVDWLIHLLEKGYLPWSAPSGLKLTELEHLVSEALPGDKKMVETLLRLLQKPMALKRLLAQFSKAIPKRIAEAIQHFEKIHGDFANAFSSVPEKPEAAFVFWKTYFTDRQLFFAQQEKTMPTVKAEKQEKAATSADIHRGEEGIFINNAGLMLLYPYLPGFLKNLDCIGSGNNIELTTKALLALHIACTGKEEAAEWELVLPKILCGIELDTPVETHFPFLEKDKKEINDLLVAIIKNWPALKNTSPDALRETFLQRNGKLVWRSDHWLLHVETQPIDVLVEKLPWGFGYAKLSWMSHPIITEWT